jgi:hypothetical protein
MTDQMHHQPIPYFYFFSLFLQINFNFLLSSQGIYTKECLRRNPDKAQIRSGYGEKYGAIQGQLVISK